MYKAIIKNRSDVVTHEPQAETLEAVQSFVAEKRLTGVYGKVAYWVNLNDATAQEVALESDRRTVQGTDPVTGANYQWTEILIPDAFTVQYVDITAAQTLAQALDERKRKREFGGELIDYISYLNDQKTLTVEDIQALSATFSAVVNILLQGSISTARTVIADLDLTGSVFTEQEKTDVLARIDAFLSSL